MPRRGCPNCSTVWRGAIRSSSLAMARRSPVWYPEGGHDRAAAHAAVARLVALGGEIRKRAVNLTDEEVRALRDEGRR